MNEWVITSLWVMLGMTAFSITFSVVVQREKKELKRKLKELDEMAYRINRDREKKLRILHHQTSEINRERMSVIRQVNVCSMFDDKLIKEEMFNALTAELRGRIAVSAQDDWNGVRTYTIDIIMTDLNRKHLKKN